MDNIFGVILNFLKDLFYLKYLPNLGAEPTYGLLFGFGIMTSFHCLGMCGGIAISQTVANINNKKEILTTSLLYNFGRIISYTLMGGIAGGVGYFVGFTGFLKGIVPIVGGVFMIIMALNLLGSFPFLRQFNIRLPKFFGKKIKNLKKHSSIYIGLMSGLMPCGPLQIVELYSLGTRSIVLGAIAMFFFSLGTIPVLIIFGAVNTIINKKHTNKILKISAILVLLLGISMINRGLSLVGISVDLPFTQNKTRAVVATMNKNIQVVTTDLKSDTFDPIIVQQGIPVEWTIKVNANNLNDCNNDIIISKLKIEKKLTVGNNLIKFTPLECGEINYTCWMGMIKSKILVVDKRN